MVIVTDNYVVPPTISEQLLSGEMKRYGSVIRYASGSKNGQIVTNLKPVDLKKMNDTKGKVSNSFDFVKTNKKTITVISGIAAISVAAYTAKKVEAKPLRKFNSRFKLYMQSIREGTLTLDKIETLEKAFNELMEHKNWEKYQMRLSANDLDILLKHMKIYTEKMAQDKNFDLPDEFYVESNSIIDLHNYLEVQKNIYLTA